MISADGLLYIANIFQKTAEVLNFEKVKAQKLISWLTDKTLPQEEIDQWLIQNEQILDAFDVSNWTYFNPNHYTHTVSSKQLGDTVFTMISTDLKIQDEIKFDIKKDGFLKGYKNIPNLFIFVAEESGFDKEPITKNLAHLGFMETALYLIGENLNMNKNDINDYISKFINENKSKIEHFLSSCAYPPKYLGAGDDGVAFDISPALVLKISFDQFAFSKAKESFDRLHKNPELGKNEAMIYDLGVLGKFGSNEIYYIILEKMTTLNNTMREYLLPIIGMIGQYVKQHKDQLDILRKEVNNPERHIDIKTALETAANSLGEFIKNSYSNQIENIESAEDLNPEWVKSLCEEIIFKYITGRGDLHLGNIGLTNYGKFVYFDPSHSYWEKNKDVVNTPSRDDVDFQERNWNEPETRN